MALKYIHSITFIIIQTPKGGFTYRFIPTRNLAEKQHHFLIHDLLTRPGSPSPVNRDSIHIMGTHGIVHPPYHGIEIKSHVHPLYVICHIGQLFKGSYINFLNSLDESLLGHETWSLAAECFRMYDKWMKVDVRSSGYKAWDPKKQSVPPSVVSGTSSRMTLRSSNLK